MLRFFSDALKLLRGSYVLVVPALVFVAITSLFDTGTPPIAMGGALAPQIIAFLSIPKVFAIALATTVVDAIGTLYMTADVYFAHGRKRGIGAIVRAFSLEEWLWYIVFTIAWYALFACFGLGIIALMDHYGPTLLARLAVIGLFAALSFPAFYAGITVSAFALTVKKDRGIPFWRVTRRVIDRVQRVYGFYMIRAIIDLATIGLVPAAIAVVLRGYPAIGFVITVGIAALSLTFTRAASMSFKLDLIEPLLTNKDIEPAYGTI